MSDANIVIDAARLAELEKLVARSGDSGLYGVTADRGFVPKPYQQLVAEGFAAARVVFGNDIDLATGSVMRKLIELQALGLADLHADLALAIDDCFPSTARGAALTSLGEAMGLPRPFMRATGAVKFTLLRPDLVAQQPDGLMVPRGTRLTTAGGHHVMTMEAVSLGQPPKDSATVAVSAFLPGESHDLRPDQPGQKIVSFNARDQWVDGTLRPLALAANPPLTVEQVVRIDHDQPLTGGTKRWGDDRYRQLLLRVPRSIWTTEAIQLAVELVPGVSRVVVVDQFGGLDLNRPIYGNFLFGEQTFGRERDIFTPYPLSIYVAAEDGAIWDGPDGLRETILAVIEDIRPIGIFASVREAPRVPVAVKARIVAASAPGAAFKNVLLARIGAYIRSLGFGEPVRAARLAWLIMSDPNVVDVQDLRIVASQTAEAGAFRDLPEGDNLTIPAGSIATFVDDGRWITVTN
ncbi:hypothetical protein [Azospirillum sp.]|uniref:hypothetical protein n=1 Tax=Azospirillum sp. TaxID=34012 RepID=UPI002D305963|nr:hypothetical protein [Azospirillum sp.]HYF90103.1 hypothetical protein [Azospirillum sp.]